MYKHVNQERRGRSLARGALMALLLACLSACGELETDALPGDDAEPEIDVATSQEELQSTTKATWQQDVVFINSWNSTGASSTSCTGILVSPKVVLTAGHCVKSKASWDVFAPYAPKVLRNGSWVMASANSTRGDVYPTYVLGNTRTRDIAVLYLNSAISAPSYSPLAPATTTVTEGWVNAYGRKTMGTDTGDVYHLAVIKQWAGRAEHLAYINVPVDTHFVIPPLSWPTPIGEPGDSGGPVLDGGGKIIGVLSGGLGLLNEMGVAVRTDYAETRTWILNRIASWP